MFAPAGALPAPGGPTRTRLCLPAADISRARLRAPSGHVILIWLRVEDHAWLRAHGFHYVKLETTPEMGLHFRSLESAWRCARLFYANHPAVLHFLEETGRSEIPFALLKSHPPCDYFWLSAQDW
jgi:hypothetical protein